MIEKVYDESGGLLHVIEHKPMCQVDFCDICGKCLACYGELPCEKSADGKHKWVTVERHQTFPCGVEAVGLGPRDWRVHHWNSERHYLERGGRIGFFDLNKTSN